jgi:hypothetical protein
MLLQTSPGDTNVQDEYSIIETIKKRLAQTRTEKEVYLFSDLHRKLQAWVGNKTESTDLCNFTEVKIKP